MQIQVSQLVTSCLTWNQHCLRFSYKNIPNPYYKRNGDAQFLNMEESALNNSALYMKSVNYPNTKSAVRLSLIMTISPHEVIHKDDRNRRI